MINHYFPSLIQGDLATLTGLFASEPLIDDPRLGRVQGEAHLRTFAADNRFWLAQRQAHIEEIATTRTPEIAVYEGILHLVHDGRPVDLPVAIAGDIAYGSATSAATERYSYLRVYYSMWPLFQKHFLRFPLLPGMENNHLSGHVADYHAALARGDLEWILQQFEPNGYAREPSGGRYVHRGQAELHRFYDNLFSNGGGIILEHCSIADDGLRCALEYNVLQFGRSVLQPQAGLAVYERGTSGRLAAARIYDDVDIPSTDELDLGWSGI